MKELRQSDIGAAERKALIALSLVSGLGPGRARTLLQKFGSASAVFESRRSRLLSVPGIGPGTAAAVQTFDRFDLVEAQLAKAQRVDARLILESDAAYPSLLKNIYDPPVYLWTRGDPDPVDDRAIAIVGTRRCTRYGREVAMTFAADLVEAGFTIVSGLAYGIDTAAHEAALQAGGRTLAILGSGVDRIYPTQNIGLANRIRQSGAVLSEFPMGTKPDAPNFPRRNRIISGMTLGTLVVEAFSEGGALITARMALEQNREVFAVPSSVHRVGGAGAGSNELIKLGQAKLVSDVSDILEELPGSDSGEQPEPVPDPQLEGRQLRLFEVLSSEPTHIDVLCSQCDVDVSDALVTLLDLEFRGLVRQLGGKYFVRC